MKKVFVFIFSCFCFLNVVAQHSLGKHLDSFASFKANYYYANAPEKLYEIDTSIDNLEEYNFVQRATDEYINLGNTGTEAFPILFKPLTRTGFQNGLHQYDLYWLFMDSIRLYDLKKPFSELTMNLGLRQELNFSGRHSQNLGKNFQYGISFNRINSIGYYKRQRTVGNTLSFYSRYITKNKKFVTYIAFLYNGFKNQQNGGLSEDIFIDSIQGLITKSLAEVRLENATNNYREVALMGSQSYEIGYKYDDKKNDTLVFRNYQPLVNIKYEIKFANNKYLFLDQSSNIDSNYYEAFYFSKIGNTNIDTLSNSLRYNSITQSISINFLGNKKVKNAAGKSINLVAGAAIQHENIELRQNFYEYTTNNLSIEGFIRSNAQANKKWNYLARAQFFLAGYNQADFDLQGKFSYDFKKIVYLLIQGQYNNRSASWTEDHYHNYANSWINNFNKVNTFLLGASYSNKFQINKFKLAGTVQVKNYVINNLIYWNTIAQAKQLKEAVNIIEGELSLNLSYGTVHLDNYICYQNSSSSNVRIPNLYLKNSLYYERLLFKKAMLFRIGVDSRYMSAYYANAYQPVIAQFYNQDEMKMKYMPLIDVFINAKIKTVRIFLKGNNLFQGIGQKGSYNAFLYPSDERSFKFGVTWRFLD